MRGSTALLACALLVSACKKKEDNTPSAPPAGSAGSQAGAGAGAAAPPPEGSAVGSAGSAAAKPPEPSDVSEKVGKVLPAIKKIAAEGAVVKAIKDQNGKKLKPDWIKEFDKEWTAATGVTDKMKPYLDNACAKAMAKYTAEVPALVEAFAMDNQGALVCSLKKTSDFWQGDEDKWTKSYADGKGAEFIDKPKFDDSSQTYSVQVSLPVTDGKAVIGAVTIGLSMDKL